MHTHKESKLNSYVEGHSHLENSSGTDDSATFPYPDRPDVPGNVTLGEN
jgi:hypothetical protein